MPDLMQKLKEEDPSRFREMMTLLKLGENSD